MLKNIQIPRHSFSWLFFLGLFFFNCNLHLIAQEPEEELETIEEKATARLSLQYFNLMEEQRLVAIVKSKVEGAYQTIPGVKVNFFRNEATNENKLESRITDEKGKAILILPPYDPDERIPWFTYFATIKEDSLFEDAEEEVMVLPSVMHMELEEEDSVRLVKIFIGSHDCESGELVPLPEIEVKVFVQRLFGLLPLFEDAETTDEEGYVNIEFPGDIPGDQEGNVVIVAKVEDHEEYGNLEFRKKIGWGLPASINENQQSRELWSARANAPFWLLFLVNSVLLGVWGVLVYIFLQLFKISRTKRISL